FNQTTATVPVPALALGVPQDPLGHAYARDRVAARNLSKSPQPTRPDMLIEDWRTTGHGTWLGRDDSLRIHDGYVWVGSADGVVTKFAVTAGTSSSRLHAPNRSATGPGVSRSVHSDHLARLGCTSRPNGRSTSSTRPRRTA